MESIKVQITINSNVQKVWDLWTGDEHITQWNFATPEWRCPSARNDLKPGGKFSWCMEAKDGSMGFDYAGKYLKIDEPVLIEKELEDGRKVTISFGERDGMVEVIETFVPDANDPELQRQGWQASLDNFKAYVEAN